jgi:hypothetical protein
MQAAIDRVIRSFTFGTPVSLRQPMPDEPTVADRNDVNEFALRLLNNYKGDLARRSSQRD